MRYVPDAPWIGKDREEYENTVIRKKYEREMEYDDLHADDDDEVFDDDDEWYTDNVETNKE